MDLRVPLSIVAALSVAPLPPGDASAVFGRWHISSDSCPNVCAMSRAESQAWHGRKASYDSTIARFGQDSCLHPLYLARVRTEADFLDNDRISMRQLGITTSTVTVVDIRCPGDWDSPGASLIVKDKDHIIAMSDGVYFELKRDQ